MRPRFLLCCLLVPGIALCLPSARAQDSSAGAELAPASDVEETSAAQSDQEKDAPPVVQDATLAADDAPRAQSSFLPSLTLPGDLAKAPSQSAAPDVYLLPDQTGKLRKVLGFRYEDFMQAWNRRPGEKILAPPRYVLDQWQVEAEVRATFVQIDLNLQISVQTKTWVDIPIQLPELIVQEIEIRDQKPGECLVFDKERFGYVLWLSGEAGKQRTLRVKGITKLEASATDASLRLHLPRANATDFQARIPASGTEIQSVPEVDLEIVQKTENATEVRLLGQSNPMQLAWKTEPSSTRSETSPLVVEEATTIQLDRRRATYRSTLLVNSFKRPLQQVRVRLPKRSTLQLTDFRGSYEVKEVASTDNEEYRLVDVILPETRLEPWSFDLVAEAPIESFGDVAECRLEGFKVLGAFQQSGLVTVEVDDQLLAYLDLHGEVEQVPIASETTVSQGRSILGQFRYTRFPWQLVVFSSPRQKRVSVKPTYDLAINEDEARLDVLYDYQLTGAQIFSMRMKLNGWQRTDAPMESGGTVDPNSVVERLDGKLAFRLVDPSTPQLTLKLSFRKDIRLGENTFYFPEPLEAYLVDGQLKVSSSQPLQLLPQFDESVGLSVLPDSEDEPLNAGEIAAQSNGEQFRLRTFLPQPKLVTEVVQREQEVLAQLKTKVEIESQTIQVRQDLHYQAKYKPTSQLSLSIPDSLWSNQSLQITLEGTPLEATLREFTDDLGAEIPSSAVQEQEAALKTVVVVLPRPMQNEIPLTLAYALPTPALKADELESLRLPFALPLDPMTDHAVEVKSGQEIQVSANQSTQTQSWQVMPSEGPAEEASSMLSFRAIGKKPFLDLYAQLESVEQNQLATLERAWFQSWFALDRRQERAVFRFHTPHSKAFVKLPAGLEGSEMELVLDGMAKPFELLEGNRLAFALPSSEVQQGHTLELRYQTASSLPTLGTLSTTVPQLEGQVASAPIYYQLILPQGWQIASSPDQLIPDYRLGWRNYRWGRQPTLSQAVLEQHTGAEPTLAPPPLANQYVFRAFELPGQVQFTVVRQIWLILTAALAAFSVGLLCIYTSFAKHASTWLLLALVLLVGVSRFPGATILVVQLILVGALMTLVTYLLRRIFVTSQEARLPVTTSMRVDPSEITEPWQEQVSVQPAFNETTTTLKTGEPTP